MVLGSSQGSPQVVSLLTNSVVHWDEAAKNCSSRAISVMYINVAGAVPDLSDHGGASVGCT